MLLEGTSSLWGVVRLFSFVPVMAVFLFAVLIGLEFCVGALLSRQEGWSMVLLQMWKLGVTRGSLVWGASVAALCPVGWVPLEDVSLSAL